MDDQTPQPASLGLTVKERIGLIVFLVGIMLVHALAIIAPLL